ncbi:MAG TPA: NAD(P)H-binding protein [Anaerolineae bacterium]|nr:NAD(P)H-binding protein [Anaerolineae bacterium]
MILVTGATGLVGRQLVACLGENHKVVCLVRPARRLRKFAPGVSVRVVSGDVDDLPTLRLAMHNVTSIVHLAAISRPFPGRTIESVNVEGTCNVIEAAQEVGVRRILFVGPLGADPHSAYLYLRTKGQAEELIKSSGLDYTIVRASSVYGEDDEWTMAMAMGMHAVPFLFPIPGDGRSRLQPLYVEDFIECLARSLTNGKTIGQTIEVGGPQYMTFDDVVTEVMRATGVRRRKYYLGVPMSHSLARLGARLMGRPPFSHSAVDLLTVNRTTALDSVPYHFGFQAARMADSLGYLAQPRPWRRMFLRFLLTRE